MPIFVIKKPIVELLGAILAGQKPFVVTKPVDMVG